VALCRGDEWAPAIKVSESPEKTINPGHKSVWRIYDQRGRATNDLLALEDEDPRQMNPVVLHHPVNHTRYRSLRREEVSAVERLLTPVMAAGRVVYDPPDIEQMRAQRQADVERLDPGVKRLVNPHIYHVSLSERLWGLKQDLIKRSQG
jgi:nicotinate phosphoribosyltransferase